MKKINFEGKLIKFRNNKKKVLVNRETKIIAKVSKLFVEYNSCILTNEILDKLCLYIYKNTNYSNRVRLFNMINNNEEIKEKIQNNMINIYTNSGIDPINKIIELSIKAENLIKTTNDAIKVIELYQGIIQNNNTKIKETREYSNYSNFKNNKPDKIEQTISTSLIQTNMNLEDSNSDSSNSDKKSNED